MSLYDHLLSLCDLVCSSQFHNCICLVLASLCFLHMAKNINSSFFGWLPKVPKIHSSYNTHHKSFCNPSTPKILNHEQMVCWQLPSPLFKFHISSCIILQIIHSICCSKPDAEDKETNDKMQGRRKFRTKKKNVVDMEEHGSVGEWLSFSKSVKLPPNTKPFCN